jgi:hypothetical protein
VSCKEEGRRQKTRQRQERHRYGVTRDELVAQLGNDNCSICGSPGSGKRRNHIDHCHAVGINRGFLCINCNRGLGNFRDDAALLAKAIAYIQNPPLIGNYYENYRDAVIDAEKENGG